MASRTTINSKTRCGQNKQRYVVSLIYKRLSLQTKPEKVEARGSVRSHWEDTYSKSVLTAELQPE